MVVVLIHKPHHLAFRLPFKVHNTLETAYDTSLWITMLIYQILGGRLTLLVQKYEVTFSFQQTISLYHLLDESWL
eukprot:c29189_g1_i1 orf=308-532(-)